MRKKTPFLLALTIAAAFASCDNDNSETLTAPNDPTGEYTLTEIHWSGLPVDINRDNIAQWALADEFDKQIGYYEPDYVTHVTKREPRQGYESYSFNIVVPYPHYIVSDGQWRCSSIVSLKMTLDATMIADNIYGDSRTFQNESAYADDPFLALVKEIRIVDSDPEKKTFRIRLHCTMPYDRPDSQELNENYMYYKFSAVKK